GHADSVAANGTRGHWWDALSQWSGPEPGAPRSLAQLAQCASDSTLLVALSPSYLEACSADLIAAAEFLSSSRRLSVICTGARHGGMLDQHLLPGDARLQHALGGTRQA